jgi:hypothetical protein
MATPKTFDGRATKYRLDDMRDLTVDTMANVYQLAQTRNPERRQQLMVGMVKQLKQIVNHIEHLETERQESARRRKRQTGELTKPNDD